MRSELYERRKTKCLTEGHLVRSRKFSQRYYITFAIYNIDLYTHSLLPLFIHFSRHLYSQHTHSKPESTSDRLPTIKANSFISIQPFTAKLLLLLQIQYIVRRKVAGPTLLMAPLDHLSAMNRPSPLPPLPNVSKLTIKMSYNYY